VIKARKKPIILDAMHKSPLFYPQVVLRAGILQGRRSPVGDGRPRAAVWNSMRARAAVEAWRRVRARATGLVWASAVRAGAGKDRYIFFFQKNEPGRLTRLDPVLAPPMSHTFSTTSGAVAF
jgi:hypothetical protein